MGEKRSLVSTTLTHKQRYVVILLSVSPAIALCQILRNFGSMSLLYGAVGYLFVIQLGTFFQMRRDKVKAMSGEWRISESILHTLELIGGWPASFIAQRKYRHKTSKKRYQFIFWLVVLLYQVLAADYLFSGPIGVFL